MGGGRCAGGQGQRHHIGPNNVAITTENFLLQLLDPGDNENVLMEMSANGNVGFKQLYADEVISDSVAQSYAVLLGCG